MRESRGNIVFEQMPIIDVSGAVPKDVLLKSTRDVLRKFADRRAQLNAEIAKWNPTTHREAEIRFNTEAAAAVQEGKPMPPPVPPLKEFLSKKKAALRARDELDAEIDATLRPIIEVILTHLRTYVRERETVEMQECRLLQLPYKPSRVAAALHRTICAMEKHREKPLGFRGCPKQILATYGFQL